MIQRIIARPIAEFSDGVGSKFEEEQYLVVPIVTKILGQLPWTCCWCTERREATKIPETAGFRIRVRQLLEIRKE